MKHIYTLGVVLGILSHGCALPVLAEPATPAPGTPERQHLMDAMREAKPLEKLTAEAGGKVVFKVHALLVEAELAVAEVTPMTADSSRSFPRRIAFLRRGGDEPWYAVAVGESGGGWIPAFLKSEEGAPFKPLWTNLQSKTTTSPSAAVRVLEPADPDHAAAVKALLSLPMVAAMKKDLGKDILLDAAKVRVAGEWAWAEGNPHTADRSWQGEPLSMLLKREPSGWSVVTGIPEEVLTADEPDAAFAKWRSSLGKAHPGLPIDLIPASAGQP